MPDPTAPRRRWTLPLAEILVAVWFAHLLHGAVTHLWDAHNAVSEVAQWFATALLVTVVIVLLRRLVAFDRRLRQHPGTSWNNRGTERP